ncbi:hypothetical protein V6N13_035003 [Hibiscus sabdariffa]
MLLGNPGIWIESVKPDSSVRIRNGRRKSKLNYTDPSLSKDDFHLDWVCVWNLYPQELSRLPKKGPLSNAYPCPVVVGRRTSSNKESPAFPNTKKTKGGLPPNIPPIRGAF